MWLCCVPDETSRYGRIHLIRSVLLPGRPPCPYEFCHTVHDLCFDLRIVLNVLWHVVVYFLSLLQSKTHR